MKDVSQLRQNVSVGLGWSEGVGEGWLRRCDGHEETYR
jgi:hypothetical protein